MAASHGSAWWFHGGIKKTYTTAAASTVGQTVDSSRVGRAGGPPLPPLACSFHFRNKCPWLVLLIIQITMLHFFIVFLLNPTMNGISEVFHKENAGLIVCDNGRPVADSVCK